MPDVKLKAPILVTRQSQLLAMLDQLRDQPALAVDTESDSLYVYKEKVCLIQISIPQADFLIDPLAGIDLRPLGKLFADPEIQSVFHAAEYDVICLRRDYGFSFANLFDTMWAARILGWKRDGLGDILQEQFGLKLDKRWQRYNWGKRPIEPAALTYARLDTHYLLRLRDIQLRELRRLDRLEEAREVFADLAQSENNGHTFDPSGYWRVKGVWDLEGRAQAILRQLYSWRDHEARRQDRPPFKVIGDHTMIELARQAPVTIGQLGKVHGLSEHQIKRYGQALLGAIKQGQTDPIPPAPRRSPPDPDVLARYERLRSWRKAIAAERGVEPDVIVGNAILMELAKRRPRTLDDLAKVDGFGPWRRRTYGQALLDVLWSK